MKKGFTLVELLAVFVILAVILLIVIPITQNVVQQSKKETNEINVISYGKSLEKAIKMYQLKEKKDPSSMVEAKKYLDYSGSEVVCSTEILNDDLSIYVSDCTVNDVLVDTSYGKFVP